MDKYNFEEDNRDEIDFCKRFTDNFDLDKTVGIEWKNIVGLLHSYKNQLLCNHESTIETGDGNYCFNCMKKLA